MTIDELENRIVEQLEAAAGGAGDRLGLFRFVLDGRGPLERELRLENSITEILEHLRERFETHEPPLWIQRIRVECRGEVDLDKRRKASDLLAEVLNLGSEIREGETAKILKPALKELFENSRINKVIDQPTDEDLRTLVESAEMLCFELLEE